MSRTFLASLVAGALAIVSLTASAATDAWPSRSMRFVVASSPGGGTDRYARLLAQSLSDNLKRRRSNLPQASPGSARCGPK